MKDFFRYDTAEQRKSLLQRARNVALSALQQYDLAWERIQFIQLSDTITYKIETSTADSYLLRIHSDRWSKEAIQSELIFLQSLNALDEIYAPVGVASIKGPYVLEIDTAEDYKRPYVTVMKWVEGEHLNGEITGNHAAIMGDMMGRLHQAAAKFISPPGFVRPVWGADSFRGEMAKLEQYYTRFLSHQAWTEYQHAAEKIFATLADMDVNKQNYGMIHADLHIGNIVFKGDQPFPIDFGRCGYGFFLYDLAGALVGLYPRDRMVFIQSYEKVRRPGTDVIRDLECFFIMIMIENYCHHASDPEETSRLIDEQPYAQACIREFLKGNPFLFNPIEPVEIDRSTFEPET
ncbi:phosphotransferase enzyme family protein [Paenibacillus sp. MABNR03]|uniref:phosphotransferase enzyme family protein n=1 Tax=Paenibacillus sp. MABNR03 TaxID=3142626 RepID=UPI003D2B4FF8